MLHRDIDEQFSHQFHHHGGFDIWRIVGIVIGIILLLAIIGFVINCLRNRNTVYGQPGVVGYGTGQQQVYY